MQCRAVREGTLCSTCGEGLLDLSNETDRMFVRMAIHRPSVADVVAVLVALAVAMVALIGLGPPARWLAGLLQLLAIAAGGMTLAVVRARPFTDFRAPGPIARNGTDRSDRSHEVQSARSDSGARGHTFAIEPSRTTGALAYLATPNVRQGTVARLLRGSD